MEGGQPARSGLPIRKVQVLRPKQLDAIITLIAFVPLVLLIFNDKNMDPKSKKVAGGVGAALVVLARLIGVSYQPPSVEQYTPDMNSCAAQIKAGRPTTACSPAVAAQAQEIARECRGRRGDEGRRTPHRSGCRVLDRTGRWSQDVHYTACFPPLRGRQSAEWQGREWRFRN
jgi:hypothetical protein